MRRPNNADVIEAKRCEASWHGIFPGMEPLQPLPIFLTETTGADGGLICGYQVLADGTTRVIAAEAMVEALEQDELVTWLHFNLSDARARRWLLDAGLLPAALREVLHERDDNRRMEATDDGVLLVMSDFTFDAEADPSEVGPLWCFVKRHLLITARMGALRSVDELRLQLRGGNTEARTGAELLATLLDMRSARLRRLANGMIDHLDGIEDEILAGDIREQRAQLGRTRRLCARLRRQFVPERADLRKFLQRPTSALAEDDRDALQSSTEALGFAIEEIAELYERAKLLQEELASRLAENTGRNLYVLSILTAVLLPMTLVTGIFGMNVADLPGLHSEGMFWRIMLLIFASGGVTLAALFWRKLL
ncbi:MAG: CorA family divalent cation transporter [Steroidobacteraceae bacterium]